MGRRLLAMDRRARRNHNAETALNRLLAVDFYLELDEGLPEEFGSASGGQRRRLPMQAKQAVYRIQCRSSSVDCIVPFRRKYLKGLLSIPSNGRGARRPLGQSFRESVGPANVKSSGGTPHSTTYTVTGSKNFRHPKINCGINAKNEF